MNLARNKWTATPADGSHVFRAHFAREFKEAFDDPRRTATF